MMKIKAIAAAVLLVSGLSTSSAATVVVTGAHFDVSYDTAFVGLFGTPTLAGDVVSFFPSGSPGFTAKTTSGFAITNSTFSLKLTAKSGFELSSFGVTEGGDYFYFSDTGSGVGVNVSGQLRVTPLPGIAVTAMPIVSSSIFVGNTFFDLTTHNWSASAATIAAPAATTFANVSIQNILGAHVSTVVDGYAFIEKKEVFLTVGVTPVPEPETAAMLLAGLGALGFLARRRLGN